MGRRRNQVEPIHIVRPPLGHAPSSDSDSEAASPTLVPPSPRILPRERGGGARGRGRHGDSGGGSSSSLSASRARGCVERLVWGIVQQDREATVLVPVWLFRRRTQVCLSGTSAAAFAALAVLLLRASGSTHEQVVLYGNADQSKTFRVSHEMQGDVLVWYDIQHLDVNRKKFVNSKDSFIFDGLLSYYGCEDARTGAEVRWRRPDDPAFTDLLRGDGEFRPCGLASVAVFMDEFKLYDSRGQEIELDETGLALPGDDAIYENKIVPVAGAAAEGPFYTVDGVDSWIPGGPFLEHLKVWYRTPVSPRVRQLWARIKGDLPAGDYTLNITVNGPVWTRHWQVPPEGKRFVLSEQSPLGSSGACRFLGIACCVLSLYEAVMNIFFIFFVKREPPINAA